MKTTEASGRVKGCHTPTLPTCFILEPNKHYGGIGGGPTGAGPDLEQGEERAKHSKD